MKQEQIVNAAAKAASVTVEKTVVAAKLTRKGSKSSWSFLKALGSAVKAGAREGYQKAKQQS